MDTTQKRKIVVGSIIAVIAASLLLAYGLSGPPQASAPDDAIRAAAEIREQLGGGKQPTNENGVPLDAIPDPNVTPGRVELKPKRG